MACKDKAENYRQSARRAVEWYLRNQVTVARTGADANAGRYVFSAWEDGRFCYTDNWSGAFAGIAVLAWHCATGRDDCLESAMCSARYLKTLQISDPREGWKFGAFREKTPTTPWLYPRDAMSVAWYFLYLHRFTGNRDWLQRAEMYGRWFCNHALDDEGWPYGTVYLETDRPAELADLYPRRLTCQLGNLSALVWLHVLTGEPVYRTAAERIARLGIERFQRPDGGYGGTEYDGSAAHTLAGSEDLGAIGMIACELCLGFAGGIAAARRYARALVIEHETHGRLLKLSVVPRAINLFLRLDRAGGTDEFRTLAYQLAETLTAQQAGPEMGARLDGGYLELMREDADTGKRVRGVCGRTTAYAITALLLLAGEEHEYLAPPRLNGAQS